MQYGMIIDVDKCVGCHACVIACKAEWEVPAQYDRNWVFRLGPSLTSSGMAATYYPGLCNHCEEPPCVPVCPADPVEMTFKDAKTGKTVTMEVGATGKIPLTGPFRSITSAVLVVVPVATPAPTTPVTSTRI